MKRYLAILILTSTTLLSVHAMEVVVPLDVPGYNPADFGDDVDPLAQCGYDPAAYGPNVDPVAEYGHDPAASECPAPGAHPANVREKKSLLNGPDAFIKTEVHESRTEKRAAVEKLAEVYTHMRPIRGDGNCFFRALGFGFLENALGGGPAGTEKIFKFIDTVIELDFDALLRDHPRARGTDKDYDDNLTGLPDVDVDQAKADRELVVGTLQELMFNDHPPTLEELVTNNDRFDKALIRVLRYATATHMKIHADRSTNGCMTYRELAKATAGDDDPQPLSQMLHQILKMGNEAENIFTAVAEATGLKFIVERLDQKNNIFRADFGIHDRFVDLAQVDAFLFNTTGHYSLLYRD